VPCHAFAAYAWWFLGYVERAAKQEQETMTEVQEMAHAFSFASALNFTSRLYHYRRDILTAQQRAEMLMSLSSEQGFPTWLAQGQMLRGWALTFQDHETEGLPQLRQGLAAWRASGANLWLPYNFALLAEACHYTGKAEEGLKVIDEALALVDENGERFWEAEIHRLKGALLLQQSPTNQFEAESCFHQALSIAKSQQSKSLELRAATSLAHLWQSQDKLLAPVYGWFTEGFDTADLQEAKTLLDELS
jgi:predicted ATPase